MNDGIGSSTCESPTLSSSFDSRELTETRRRSGESCATAGDGLVDERAWFSSDVADDDDGVRGTPICVTDGLYGRY